LAQAEGFASAFENEGGVVPVQIQPEGSGAIAAALAKLDEEPDALFVAGETARAAEWIESVRASGFEGAIMGGPEVGSPLTVEVAGPASEGVFYVSPFVVPADDPAFRAAYVDLSGGAAPGPVAAWCYSAARQLLDVIEEAKRSGAQPLRTGVSAALAGRGTGEPAIMVYVIRNGNVWTPAWF
jgi:ABC-type branched-subunit amino acid transport system substrate-binding protein